MWQELIDEGYPITPEIITRSEAESLPLTGSRA